jgi:hypothetical protein
MPLGLVVPRTVQRGFPRKAGFCAKTITEERRQARGVKKRRIASLLRRVARGNLPRSASGIPTNYLGTLVDIRRLSKAHNCCTKVDAPGGGRHGKHNLGIKFRNRVDGARGLVGKAPDVFQAGHAGEDQNGFPAALNAKGLLRA